MVLDDCWYSMISALWKLQRFNEANGLRNFTIISQYSNGRKAIHIDQQTMVAILNSLVPYGSNKNSYTVEFMRVLSKIWNWETDKRKFDFAITTDGADLITLQMAREKPKKKNQKEWDALKKNKLH